MVSLLVCLFTSARFSLKLHNLDLAINPVNTKNLYPSTWSTVAGAKQYACLNGRALYAFVLLIFKAHNRPTWPGTQNKL